MRILLMCVVVLALGSCKAGESAPSKVDDKSTPWSAYAVGLPADSFPLPSRRFSSIVAPRWSSEIGRDASHEVETVMDSLGIRSGMSVADVGAGDGYYALRLSERVGAKGWVFAEDIVPGYLRQLSERIRQAKAKNVTVVRGAPHDPRLPNDSLDAATMIQMYHEVSDPYALLWNLAHSLKPGARVGILDSPYPTDQHGTPPWLLVCELGQVGYTHEHSFPLPNDEYLAIFHAPTRATLPSPSELRKRVNEGKCLQR